jgi:NADPH-dependent ferric siderophore reductase
VSDAAPTGRRPPPPFRRATVTRIERITTRLIRVELTGAELREMAVPEPAGSVRLLLPTARGLVIPEWTGNLFVLPDGTRATIRTLTPLGFDSARGTVALEIVDHGPGAATGWVRDAVEGDEVAVSGPARGWVPGPDDRRILLAGDETAIPALRQLLGATAGRHVTALVEVPVLDAMVELTAAGDATLEWLVTPAGTPPGQVLADTLAAHPLHDVDHVWAGGEAAAMQRIRRDLFEVRGLPRHRATVRGYWKFGRAEGS